MYGFSAIALDCLMTPFIRVAFGAWLDIPETAVHLMALNFYLAGIRQPNPHLYQRRRAFQTGQVQGLR